MITLYLDGVVAGVGGLSSIGTPTGLAIIGARHTGASASLRFNGVIDDLRLYNRALAAGEVARLAQGHGCVTEGISWITAFRELQCAIAEAAPGDEILIAKGIYYPGVNAFSNFNVENNLHLYGGYNNGDPALPRPVSDFGALASQLTILSADINRNDSLTSPDFAAYSGNSRRVVHLSAANTTHIQGVQMRGGNAITAGGFDQGAGMRIFPGGSATLVNVSFFANMAIKYGGGIFSEGPLQVTDSEFISNTTTSFGGGAINSTAILTVTASTFVRNVGVSDGGAIEASALATIVDSKFFTNTAKTFHGGAIQSMGTLNVIGSEFRGNLAGFAGGAIYMGVGATAANIVDSTFKFNSVTTFAGGAIEAPFVNLTVVGSTFENNLASSSGGAIDAILHVTQTLSIEGSTFRNNFVSGINCTPLCSHANGGAVAAISGGSVVINNAEFFDNNALKFGGALFLDTNTRATIDGSTFSGNGAGDNVNPLGVNKGDGGAVFARGTLSVDETHFETNGAGLNGGAIQATSMLTVTRSTFEANRTGEMGAGIMVTGTGRLRVEASEFLSNTSGYGGGITTFASGSVVDSRFVANTADEALVGAALRVDNDVFTRTVSFIAERNQYINHVHAAIFANAFTSGMVSLVVQNSLFKDNFSSNVDTASDIHNENSTVAVLHNTFINNRSAALPFIDAASIIGDGGITLVTNNIFAFAGNYAAIRTDNTPTMTESHNLFLNAVLDPDSGAITSQGGTVTGDPQFVNAAGDNFHLSAASPARQCGHADRCTGRL